ncbi:MAG: hypothetical protein D6160_19810 [Ketobacter sp.]|nr:MAG: hypothetical protein D6160_19810 [Ketobacter sp.]
MKAVWIAGGVLASVVNAVLADSVISDGVPMGLLQADQRQPISQLVLGGQWVSNCYQLELGQYQIRSYDFRFNQLATITTTSYPDQDCVQVPTGTVSIAVAWQLDHHLTTEEGMQAFAMDVQLRIGESQELVNVKQILYYQQDHLYLGISRALNEYPHRLDWEIEYRRAKASGA